MECPFQVGDVVVAVDDGGFADDGCPLPALAVRALYTVAGVEVSTESECGGCGSAVLVDVAEIQTDPDWGYCPCSFRFAYRPDLSVSLERDVPAPTPKVRA